MSAPFKLTEGMVNQIIAAIQTQIGPALDAVAGAVTRPSVSLETPFSYFTYAKPQGYKVPAIFVLSDDMDFKIQEHKANFISAVGKVNVSVVVEDQEAESTLYKAWRYQSALHYVLDEAVLTTADQKLVNKIIVYHHKFSDLYFDIKGPSGGASFRKEVVLMCNVEHRESF